MPLLPIWDALAFFIWLISFGRKSIRWRDQEYFIRDGQLVPATPMPRRDEPTDDRPMSKQHGSRLG